jgi:aspartyl-tRNA(Asn)/glutamyl-tRNA(Gln) amidotransferase subunit C
MVRCPLVLRPTPGEPAPGDGPVARGRAGPHRLPVMSDLTRDDVAHLAGLARIDLTDAELDRMVGELGVILEAVATVQQAPIADVEPMSHPMPIVNVTRPDVVRPSLTPEEALSGAPEAEQQRFSVPRILDDE